MKNPLQKERILQTDVVVVGSGAAGGMAAYTLANAGIKTLMIESGRNYEPLKETPMFNWSSDAPLAAAGTPDKEQGFFDATVNGGYEVPGEPYSVAEGSRFKWWRARMLGGRTNHWGRISLRFGPYDFVGKSRDGLGLDWPINYEDIAPYYDKVENLVGIFGAAEGIENSPDSPEGVLHTPPKMRASDYFIKKVLEGKHNVPVVPAHMAILTRQHGDRPPCFYATDCLRGCSIRANFQSTTVLIPPALKTGNLTVHTDAHVFEVTVDAKGKADGVLYIDRESGEIHKVKARAVMLGASTFETARIMLNSKSSLHPDGIGNGSGHVGRNIMDTPKMGVAAQIPALENLPPFADEGTSLFHTYSPWWDYKGFENGKLDFARGYHLEFWAGRRMLEAGDIETYASLSGKYGNELSSDMRRLFGSVIYMSASGEMIPNDKTYCELNTDLKDQWGIPTLKFHWQWGKQELNTCKHQRDTMVAMMESMNGRLLGDYSKPIEESMRPGGTVIHEAGAARMSSRPQDGVLDKYGRCWDVPNLYAIDGSTFTSMPDKNPTLTILALAMRSSEFLINELGQRNS